MFNKILIANRGEIACRIIRTVRNMGIKSVAVYSEADANSAHVSLADEAVFIGPSPATESYLDFEKILGAIAISGADAVHPAYGFLSENREFCHAVEKAGVAFIGPSSESIRLMGDKITAKKVAIEAGVDTIPGYMGVIKDATEATTIASEIGFPIMIKAAAGGGGKGMRVVKKVEEIEQAFSSAMNEAKNSFKDDRVFIEKFIEKPRHIEIQVLADKHGNIVCLGERECSIQRHNQKVIEEAPSSFVNEESRNQMYEQCISLVKKVGYYSAGTVEFMMDSNRDFYFLEMNTRLQVEHPVTELITGIDLVEQMIKVAACQKLEFKQDDIKLDGWAIESRVYAEDPIRGFLPSSGRISEYQEPESSPNVRVDSGVYEGGQVSMFYDAMISKLCTFGQTRAEAIEHMQSALGEYVIHGVTHNIGFLEALIGHERFKSGDINTNFIAEEYPDGFSGAELTSEKAKVFLCVAIYIHLEDAHRAITISDQIPGRQRVIGNRWVVSIDEERFPVYVRFIGGGYEIRHENEVFFIKSSWILGNRLFHGTLGDLKINVQLENFAGGYYLTHAGSVVKTMVRSPRVSELEKFMPEPSDKVSETNLEAPISGNIAEVSVSVGDKVKAGNKILILEAMKMENIIFAEKDVVIKEILVSKGENVSYGQLLVEFEKADLK